jgi:hypothetical protein
MAEHRRPDDGDPVGRVLSESIGKIDSMQESTPAPTTAPPTTYSDARGSHGEHMPARLRAIDGEAPSNDNATELAIVELPDALPHDRLASLARVLARIFVEQAISELDNSQTMQDTILHGEAANENGEG